MPKAQTKQEGLLDTWGRRNRVLRDQICDNCGKMFRPKRRGARYCSRRCTWDRNGKNQKRAEGEATWWINDKGYRVGRVWMEGRRVFKRYHRWLIEQLLGVVLPRHVVVHHINSNKLDNRFENLQVIGFGRHNALSNKQRPYKKGYKLILSAQERTARSDRAKVSELSQKGRAAITKAERGGCPPLFAYRAN